MTLEYDELAYNYAYAGTDNRIAVRGLALSGEKAENYVLADDYGPLPDYALTTSVPATITKRTLTPSIVGAEQVEKVYDGTTAIPADAGLLIVLTGMVEGESPEIDASQVVYPTIARMSTRRRRSLRRAWSSRATGEKTMFWLRLSRRSRA